MLISIPRCHGTDWEGGSGGLSSSRWDSLLGFMLVNNQLIIQADGLGGLKALGLPILIGFAQPRSLSAAVTAVLVLDT